jgi:DUF4097 and DUF4098 domain-containing protein YvlB
MSQEAAMHSFSTPHPVHLRVEVWEGTITVLAEETDTTTVELVPESSGGAAAELIDRATVEQRGDEIVVLLPKSRGGGLFRRGADVAATIHVPLTSAVTVQSASADMELVGVLGNVKASTGSGDVRIEHAQGCSVRTGSGDVSIGTVHGACTVKSGSADVSIELVAGDCDLVTGSGDLLIDTVAGRLNVKSGSGDVLVKTGDGDVDAMAGSGDLTFQRVQHGEFKAKTGSGDIAIGVASGTAAYLDIMTMSGDVSSELDGAEGPSDGDPTVKIRVMSGSGDVVLQRA